MFCYVIHLYSQKKGQPPQQYFAKKINGAKKLKF